MDSDFYFQQLYPLQDRALELVGSAGTGFYLSGGTAASRGYLQHRFSDDLDLFVDDDDRFGLWAARVIRVMSQASEWRSELLLQEERFVRLSLTTSRQGVELKIEMINDVPARVGKVTVHPTLGRLDSAENLLANKITALLDREEPKDLADIWGFCCRMGLRLAAALVGAQGKAAGVFPVDLARVLLSASRADWEQVRWIQPPPPEQYLAELHALGESLVLIA